MGGGASKEQRKQEEHDPAEFQNICSQLSQDTNFDVISSDECVDIPNCSVCLDSLPKFASKFVRMTCCGQGMHFKCRDSVVASSMSDTQKLRCVMCRAKYPTSEKEAVEMFRRWVEKGKAWAQSGLGGMYERGLGVEQSYQHAVELYTLAKSGCCRCTVQSGCHVRKRSRCGAAKL